MFYNKPKDMRYVDMAIYVDNHIHEEDKDEELIFKYIYLLCHMLASKKRYFHKAEDYDNFSIYLATDIYMRMINKDLTHIKSVLNYIKGIIGFRRIEYQNSEFYQGTDNFTDSDCNENDIVTYTFKDQIAESTKDLKNVDFTLMLNTIPDMCYQYLKRIPYKSDKVVWNNIYKSCLMSLISLMTPTYESLKKLNRVAKSKNIDLELLYDSKVKDCIILYHLDKSMYNYIYVLVNQLRHMIAKNLSEMLETFIPPQLIVRDVYGYGLSDYDEDREGD